MAMASWAVSKCSWGTELFPDFSDLEKLGEKVIEEMKSRKQRAMLSKAKVEKQKSSVFVRKNSGKVNPVNDEVINLRLILVSGKTKEFLFSPNDSAGDIAQHVFDNWPEDWSEEAVAKADILRLIYQGRFLHSNVTLGALGLVCSKTTVMHLVPRENLPEPNSQDQRQKSKGGGSSCCSASCTIL